MALVVFNGIPGLADLQDQIRLDVLVVASNGGSRRSGRRFWKVIGWDFGLERWDRPYKFGVACAARLCLQRQSDRRLLSWSA